MPEPKITFGPDTGERFKSEGGFIMIDAPEPRDSRMSHEDHDDAIQEADRLTFFQRFNPSLLGDIAQGALRPPPWLFSVPDGSEGLLRSKTLTMVSAEPFTGKTMLLLALGLGLSTLRPILGFQPAAGHRVLFLGQDAPTWDYHGVIRKLWIGLEAPPIPESALFFLNRGLRLTASNELITEAVRVHRITVLMLDTLLAFHQADENSNKEMAEVMDLLKSWRDRLGLTILFTHHTGKPSGLPGQISGNYRARGASVISGSVDFHLQLIAKGGVVQLSLPKRRGGTNAASAFTIIEGGEGGLRLEPCAVLPSPTRMIADFLLVPRSKDDLLAFIGSRFPGEASATEGRFHGALGYLRRKKRLLSHPDGTYQVRPTAPSAP